MTRSSAWRAAVVGLLVAACHVPDLDTSKYALECEVDEDCPSEHACVVDTCRSTESGDQPLRAAPVEESCLPWVGNAEGRFDCGDLDDGTAACAGLVTGTLGNRDFVLSGAMAEGVSPDAVVVTFGTPEDRGALRLRVALDGSEEPGTATDGARLTLELEHHLDVSTTEAVAIGGVLTPFAPPRLGGPLRGRFTAALGLLAGGVGLPFELGALCSQ